MSIWCIYREKPNGKYSVSRGLGLDMRAEIANHARLAADIINYLIITAICDECKKREWAANEPHHRIVGPKQQKLTPKSDSSSISSQIICNFCLFKNYIRPISVWVICTERERETEGEHKPHTRKHFPLLFIPCATTIRAHKKPHV